MGKTPIKIGDKFNLLTVLFRVKSKIKKNNAYFACKCECGNFTVAQGTDMKNGHTKSCGCLSKINLKKAWENRSGKVSYNHINYNYLEPVGECGFLYLHEEETKNNIRYATFLCPHCKQPYYSRISVIKNNSIKSCGCKKESLGVKKIKEILENNKINFDTEYTYSDCKNINLLPFDFHFYFNNEEILIEFDGIQHFLPKWGQEELIQTRIRDNIKNNYCKQKGIKLYRIPYTDETKFYNLENLLNNE